MKNCVWIVVALVLVGGVVQADEAGKLKAISERSMTEGGTTARAACNDFPICTGFEMDCQGDLGGDDDGWIAGWMCEPFIGGTSAACQAAFPAPRTANPIPGTSTLNCSSTDPNGRSGWYISASSQQCEEPHVTGINPFAGDLHLRFSAEPEMGCQGFTGPCRITGFTPIESPATAILGPVTAKCMVAGNAYGGANLEFWTQTSVQGFRTTRTWLDWYGFIWLQDDSGYINTGTYWTPGGVYKEWRMEINPCTDVIDYYYDGVLYFTGPTWAGTLVDAAFFMTDNYDTDYDVDNYCITRYGPCPSECGNGIVEPGEECESDAICGLGTCIPNNGGHCVDQGGGDYRCVGGLHDGEVCDPLWGDMSCDDPDDCTCDRACADPNLDPECELHNGTQSFLTFGGWAWFTADTPSTAVNLCGSEGTDTFLMMNWVDGMIIYPFVAFNDDCAPWDPYGMQDPLASCYYPNISTEWYESCTCLPTTLGDIYMVQTDYFGEVPAGYETDITIEKRMVCDEIFETGACCNPEDGTCEDFVSAQDCKPSMFHQSKLCEFTECLPQPAACCDGTPGLGGVCTDGVLAADCDGQWDTWYWPDCASIECDEVKGACCDHAPGLGGFCLDDKYQRECVGPQKSWFKAEVCANIECTEAVGACCNSDAGPLATAGLCEDGLLSSECTCEKCVWYKGQECAQIECEANFVAIPTVSVWGMAILTLLLLAGAKVYFNRREATA